MTDQFKKGLTVSIVAYHSPIALLRATIASLAEAVQALRDSCGPGEPWFSPESEVTLYLVDNSEDQSLSLLDFQALSEPLRSAKIELRLLQGHGNVGYGAGHNLAVSQVVSRYHLLLNPDVELHASSLVVGTGFLENNTGVCAASPGASFEDGSRQHLCKQYPSVWLFFLRGFAPAWLRHCFAQQLARYEMHELTEEPAVGVPIISGCFMLCKTEALKTVRGFDPGYFLYFEDFDLSLRLGKQGKLACVPAMKIVHHGGHSAAKGWHHIRLFVRSGWRFFNTYGWRLF